MFFSLWDYKHCQWLGQELNPPGLAIPLPSVCTP